MKLQDMTLAERLKEIEAKRIIALSKRGNKFEKEDLFQGLKKKDDFCAIIGGFPHGEFLSDVDKLSDEMIRIYPETS